MGIIWLRYTLSNAAQTGRLRFISRPCSRDPRTHALTKDLQQKMPTASRSSLRVDASYGFGAAPIWTSCVQ